jgi:Flp pilus assembly pilin Flp
MKNWWAELQAFLAAERGATMVEYGLVVVLIGIVSLFVVSALGMDVFGSLDMAQNSFNGPGAGAPTP